MSDYSYDPLSATTIYRTGIVPTLVALFTSTISEHISALAIWSLNRICRTPEIAKGLVKRNLVRLLLHSGLTSTSIVARTSAWCLGALVQNDSLAETLADMDAIPPIITYLSRKSALADATSDDISSGLFVIARMARSIKLSKALAKAGCIPLLANQLGKSVNPQILQWSARAVGCLMRPNSSDMSKLLLEAGIANGLARLPRVLPTEEVKPLASFAFAVQRFRCVKLCPTIRQYLPTIYVTAAPSGLVVPGKL